MKNLVIYQSGSIQHIEENNFFSYKINKSYKEKNGMLVIEAKNTSSDGLPPNIGNISFPLFISYSHSKRFGRVRRQFVKIDRDFPARIWVTKKNGKTCIDIFLLQEDMLIQIF